MLTTRVDVRGLDSVMQSLNDLPDQLRDKATTAALNKVSQKAKTEMVRAITDEYNIKRDEVASKMRLSGATKNGLTATLDPFASGYKGRALNLIHFLDYKATNREAKRSKRKRSKQKTGGRDFPVLFFKIKKGEAAKPIPGTFLGNKGRTVFIRIGNKRLPIKAVSTVGVPQMFNTKNISNRVVDRIMRELPVEFERAAAMVLVRYSK